MPFAATSTPNSVRPTSQSVERLARISSVRALSRSIQLMMRDMGLPLACELRRAAVGRPVLLSRFEDCSARHIARYVHRHPALQRDDGGDKTSVGGMSARRSLLHAEPVSYTHL